MEPVLHGRGRRAGTARAARPMTAADDAPRCEWSTVCRLWPGHRLVRVQYRDAPVEHVRVCDDHLPHALAKGFTQAAGGAWPGPAR